MPLCRDEHISETGDLPSILLAPIFTVENFVSNKYFGETGVDLTKSSKKWRTCGSLPEHSAFRRAKTKFF